MNCEVFPGIIRRACIVLLASIFSLQVQAQTVNPADIPFPEDSFLNGTNQRALVVRVLFTSRADVEFQSATVSNVSAPSHLGDPPILRIRLFDSEDTLIEQFNHAHPMWVEEWSVNPDSGETDYDTVYLDEVEGAFAFPFSTTLARMEIEDVGNNQVVGEIDLKPIVLEFCQENPTERICEEFGLADSDGDGINNEGDNCLIVPNPEQENTDGDSKGDACDPDDDGDNVDDDTDNCPLVPNEDQANFDNDEEGDACDADDDNDNVEDSADICPETAPSAEVDADGCSASQRDTDGDSVPDNLDACPDTPLGTEVDETGCPLASSGEACDVDMDGDVDRVDIWRVILSIGKQGIEPGDPRDPNTDGWIGLKDLYICLRSCDRPKCAKN